MHNKHKHTHTIIIIVRIIIITTTNNNNNTNNTTTNNKHIIIFIRPPPAQATLPRDRGCWPRGPPRTNNAIIVYIYI